MPEVGCEVMDDQGAIVGEFEVAWPEQRVGVRTAFRPAEWQVVEAADALARPEQLVSVLGLGSRG